MKQNTDVQDYLEQVEMVDAIIPNKLIEIQQWYDVATSITAAMNGECVHSSGSKQKMADAVNKCMDVVSELTYRVDQLRNIKTDVVQTIEQVESPTWYKLLHLRYIQFVPLVDIADQWGTEYTNITTAHGRALKNVEKLLNEKNKNTRAG